MATPVAASKPYMGIVIALCGGDKEILTVGCSAASHYPGGRG
jgi:hypothetical protein